MGALEGREERSEEVDVRALLSPMRSFVRSALEAAEEDFAEILCFIDSVVEMSSRNDPKLLDYIREAGGEARLKAYRFLAGLVRARKDADEFIDGLARDIAEVLKAKRQKTS
jgi:hypothetical protein